MTICVPPLSLTDVRGSKGELKPALPHEPCTSVRGVQEKNLRRRADLQVRKPVGTAAGEEKKGHNAAHFGARIITIRRPCIEGSCSTLATSSSSTIKRFTTLNPSSTWAFSRPRKITEQITLSRSLRKCRA